MSTRPYRRLFEEDQPAPQQGSPEAAKAAHQAQSVNALKIKLANDIANLTAAIDKKEKEKHEKHHS